MKIIEADTIIEIPFFDLDPMNVVWHGNYVKYTEIARCNLLNKIGYNYDDMRADGVMYPVAKMEMKFIKSVAFGQKILVKAVLDEIEPSLNMHYEIKDFDTKEVLFKAKTMQIGVEFATRKSIYEAPEKLKKGIECF